jgi:hypothetical protein
MLGAHAALAVGYDDKRRLMIFWTIRPVEDWEGR